MNEVVFNLHIGTDKELIDDDLRLVNKKKKKCEHVYSAIFARKFITKGLIVLRVAWRVMG